jgi:hypothetical protein
LADAGNFGELLLDPALFLPQSVTFRPTNLRMSMRQGQQITPLSFLIGIGDSFAQGVYRRLLNR